MKRANKSEIDLDEVFLDLTNSPGYNRESLEGALEKPIRRELFIILGGIFCIGILIFLGRISFLEIYKGIVFRERSDKNYLKVVVTQPERGVIYDRFGVPLVEDSWDGTDWQRKYPPEGFLHILGYLAQSANTPGALEGAVGLEFSYNDILKGSPEEKLEEVNAKGEVVGSSLNKGGGAGSNILTSISKDLQLVLTEKIKETMRNQGFSGGAGVIIDTSNGEILAVSSAPDFDPNLLYSNNSAFLDKILNDPGKPFFNRAVSGLYPPGSIVKPAVAAGALAEKVIDPETKILSTGSISIPNPYFPGKPSVFPDWRPQGWVDMRQALAVSSDVYFYEVGGGYQNQKGLGAWNIKKYFSLFGFGEKTGVDIPGEKDGFIPDPNNHKVLRDWTLGDTYHLAIGQGELVVTPLQIVVYTAALATKGTLYYPHIVKATLDKDKKVIEKFSYPARKENILPQDIFNVIQEGMRRSAIEGTASGLGGLPIEVAAKTGTAEIGDTKKVDSWSIGFFPYESPRLAFTIMMEGGVESNLVGATYVASEVIRWIADTHFLDKLNNNDILN